VKYVGVTPHLHIILLIGILVQLPVPRAVAQDKYIGEFGVTEGEPVDAGVVFIDGEYLTSPYIVSRRGLTLHVNNRQIKRPRHHMETPILTGEVDPSRLTEQERQKLFRALEATRRIYEEYLSKGYGYLFSSKGGHIRLSPRTIGYGLPKVAELLASDILRDEKLQRLKVSNWHLHIDIEPLVDNFVPSPHLTHRMTKQAEELLGIQEFGVGEALSVANGFAFLNGRYLEPRMFSNGEGGVGS